MRTAWRVWLVAVMTVGASAVALAQEGDIIDQMLARWKERPVDSVRYVLEGEKTVPAKSLPLSIQLPDGGIDLVPALLPAADYTYEIRTELILDFKNQRLRMDERAEEALLDYGAFFKTREIHLFNSTEFQRYEPRRDSEYLRYRENKYATELTINLDPSSSAIFHKRHYAPLGVFLSLGILPGPEGSWPTPEQLVPATSRESLSIVAEDMLDGVPCAVVEMPLKREGNSLRFWVSKQEPGKILRCTFIWGDSIHWTLQLDYDGWNLAGTTRWSPDPEGKLRVVEKMIVKAITVNPSLDDVVFHMEPTVGMVYNDRRADKRFRIERRGEPGVDVQVLYAREQQETEEQESDQQP